MFPLLLLCLQIPFIRAAPLQVQLLQPLLQPQQTSLQQQLMELQQLQALRRLNGLRYSSLNLPRPLLILLPKSHQTGDNTQTANLHNLRNQDPKKNHGIENEERDSIIIDAEPETQNVPAQGTQKALLLLPSDERGLLGDFISSIPFLPIEINVPDSISWIYNGISSIISGIGQRLPFRPQTLDELESSQEQNNMRIKALNNQNVAPILVVPMGQQFSMYK